MGISSRPCSETQMVASSAKNGEQVSKASSSENNVMKTSTSMKHRNFLSEPMGEKCVSQIAGIGEVYKKRLHEAGYDLAYVLFGQFLLLKKDHEGCYECLRDYCTQ